MHENDVNEELRRKTIDVRAAQVRPLLALAAASGVDVGGILKSAGLALDAIERDEYISLADYFRIQNEISMALDDETLHMSSRQLLPGTTDFIMARLAGASSLIDAMKILAQSYNLLHGGDYNAVRRRGDAISFIIDDRRFPYATKEYPEFIHFSLECVQVFLHCMLAVVSRPHAQAGLRRVSVTRMGRSSDSVHLDFWRTPIRYGAPIYSLEYDFEIASARILTPQVGNLNAAHVYSEIAAAAASEQRGGRGAEMSDFVRQSLARGVIDQTRIAALAGLSVATLRRRLETEGLSFRDLRREVLNEAAKQLLRRRVSVSEAAEELGFSDFRSFNRAFKTWNGVTPKAYVEKAAPKHK